ncbi:MAG TPA: hypothetical protein PLX23_04740 [Candidatus Hydrogenedens sp.]|nr:hypothetical protein [Candidatus Hydrogenedens sp.]
MKICYCNCDGIKRGYRGLLFESPDKFKQMICSEVKCKLRDEPQRKNMLDILDNLKNDVNFESSKCLKTDYQLLLDNVESQNFRIGEAIAEVVLEDKFKCRFYWNEIRDARNQKGNKTGADLVGFIQYTKENDNEILFLFGEVKTSSEKKSPPQVMTQKNKGMADQLKDLHLNNGKRLNLICYLQSKIDIHEKFKQDFKKAVYSYYKPDDNYQLFGVLVRDTQENENDLKSVYENLKNTIPKSTGLNLVAIYVPIKKAQWQDIINEKMQ